MQQRDKPKATQERLCHTRGVGAFTLIEVNLAILLVATGILTLLALFPLGLRQGELAIMDTHEAMFATHVLSGLEGNALSVDMMNWSIWSDHDRFRVEVSRGVSPVQNLWDNTVDGVEWPLNSDRRIRYRLEVNPDPSSDDRVWTVTLQIKSGVYGSFDNESRFYVTKLVYLGDVTWSDI